MLPVKINSLQGGSYVIDIDTPAKFNQVFPSIRELLDFLLQHYKEDGWEVVEKKVAPPPSTRAKQKPAVSKLKRVAKK